MVLYQPQPLRPLLGVKSVAEAVEAFFPLHCNLNPAYGGGTAIRAEEGSSWVRAKLKSTNMCNLRRHLLSQRPRRDFNPSEHAYRGCNDAFGGYEKWDGESL